MPAKLDSVPHLLDIASDHLRDATYPATLADCLVSLRRAQKQIARATKIVAEQLDRESTETAL